MRQNKVVKLLLVFFFMGKSIAMSINGFLLSSDVASTNNQWFKLVVRTVIKSKSSPDFWLITIMTDTLPYEMTQSSPDDFSTLRCILLLLLVAALQQLNEE